MENLNELLDITVSVLCLMLIVYSFVVLARVDKDSRKSRKILEKLEKDQDDEGL